MKKLILATPFLNEHDILIFTESGLHDGISNLELGLDEFNIFRKDRSSSTSESERLGGVMIAVSNQIKSGK